MNRLPKVAAVVAATCLALALLPRLARSADHLDAPATKEDHTADLNDLYSWMDGPNAVFALTVFPAAPPGALFSDKVLYVIHTTSSAKFGDPETNKDIICRFAGTAAPQTTSCWLGTDEYATGNGNEADGIVSKDGKFKVFAGIRRDPFFFNLDGFNASTSILKNLAVGFSFDGGCPVLNNTTAQSIADAIRTDGGGGAGSDFFKDLNTLAIVVSVDKALITDGGPMVSSWASTITAP